MYACIYMYIYTHIYICMYIYISGHIRGNKWSTTHRVVKSHRSKMSVIYSLLICWFQVQSHLLSLKSLRLLSLSRFSMHLADFFDNFTFFHSDILFIFNKCWFDAFFIFKVFFKIFIALNKVVDSKISEISKQLKFPSNLNF